MENQNKFTLDAKKAIIGGVIAIIFSPISIIIAFYLGQQLDRPKLANTNVEQIFTYVKPDSLFIPDSILNPIKGNQELFMLSFDIEESDFKDNYIKKEDVEDIIDALNSISAKYDYSINIITKNINKIEDWDGKKNLILDPINPSLLGGKSLNEMVKSDKKLAINTLKSILNTAINRKQEISKYTNLVSPLIKNDIKRERSGELSFKIGILNSGKTDAVIFPKAELIFQGKTLYYKSSDKYSDGGYFVINSHSFKLISFKLDNELGNKKDIDEWNALIKNHTTEKFEIKVHNTDKDITISGNLEAK